MTQELTIAEPGQIVRQVNTDNPIAAMLQAITDRGVTSENAAALEKVCDLYIRMEGEAAKKHFAGAFAKLQAELPVIVATKIIPNDAGGTRSKFTPLEDIMGKIKPHLEEHGFSVSFDSELWEHGITAICILTHTSGHEERRKFSVRTSPPPKTSPAQQDGATLTYAKRYALCGMFNINIDKDTDARTDGDFISEDQARELEMRVRATGRDISKFLKLAGADSFIHIREGKYSAAVAALMKAEKAKRDGAPTHTPPTASIPHEAGASATPTGDASAILNGPAASGENVAEITQPATSPEPSADPEWGHWFTMGDGEVRVTWGAMKKAKRDEMWKVAPTAVRTRITACIQN